MDALLHVVCARDAPSAPDLIARRGYPLLESRIDAGWFAGGTLLVSENGSYLVCPERGDQLVVLAAAATDPMLELAFGPSLGERDGFLGQLSTRLIA